MTRVIRRGFGMFYNKSESTVNGTFYVSSRCQSIMGNQWFRYVHGISKGWAF